MNTILERAAGGAMGVQVGEDGEGYPVFPGPNTATELARAVLMAIREPDDAMILAGYEGGPHYDDIFDPGPVFTAMIDAILEGK